MASGGTLTSQIEVLPGVQSLQVDYDLDERIYRYRRLSTLMLGCGLFHPTPAWIVTALLIAIGSGVILDQHKTLEREALASAEHR